MLREQQELAGPLEQKERQALLVFQEQLEQEEAMVRQGLAGLQEQLERLEQAASQVPLVQPALA